MTKEKEKNNVVEIAGVDFLGIPHKHNWDEKSGKKPHCHPYMPPSRKYTHGGYKSKRKDVD